MPWITSGTGLGAMIIDNPDVKYFFGKMTMYPQYNSTARDIILWFLRKYFPDDEHLLTPKKRVVPVTDEAYIESIFQRPDIRGEL